MEISLLEGLRRGSAVRQMRLFIVALTQYA